MRVMHRGRRARPASASRQRRTAARRAAHLEAAQVLRQVERMAGRDVLAGPVERVRVVHAAPVMQRPPRSTPLPSLDQRLRDSMLAKLAPVSPRIRKPASRDAHQDGAAKALSR
jgi:hypothetical protein